MLNVTTHNTYTLENSWKNLYSRRLYF